jgi:hypothetical protein
MKKRSIKGKLSVGQLIKCNDAFYRYIDQCQELLDAPRRAERKDLDIYQGAVRTATGETADWPDEYPDEVFMIYVEQGTSRYLDGAEHREVLPITFNYERWVASS